MREEWNEAETTRKILERRVRRYFLAMGYRPERDSMSLEGVSITTEQLEGGAKIKITAEKSSEEVTLDTRKTDEQILEAIERANKYLKNGQKEAVRRYGEIKANRLILAKEGNAISERKLKGHFVPPLNIRQAIYQSKTTAAGSEEDDAKSGTRSLDLSPKRASYLRELCLKELQTRGAANLLRRRLFRYLTEIGFQKVTDPRNDFTEAMRLGEVEVTADATKEGAVVKVTIPLARKSLSFRPAKAYSRNIEEIALTPENFSAQLRDTVETAIDGLAATKYEGIADVKQTVWEIFENDKLGRGIPPEKYDLISERKLKGHFVPPLDIQKEIEMMRQRCIKNAERRVTIERNEILKEEVYDRMREKGFRYTTEPKLRMLGDAVRSVEKDGLMEGIEISADTGYHYDGALVYVAIPMRISGDPDFQSFEDCEYAVNVDEIVVNARNMDSSLEHICNLVDYGNELLVQVGGPL